MYTQISPIKQLQTSSKAYETPGKSATFGNGDFQHQTSNIWKEKALRLEDENQSLKDEIRVLEAQNKQLKTQVQIYRSSSNHLASHRSSGSGEHSRDEKSKTRENSVDDDRTSREIRILKNSHEMEVASLKDSNKKLTAKVAELQSLLDSQKESNSRSNSSSEHTKDQLIEKQSKELSELKKSIVNYIQERDEANARVQRLKEKITDLNEQIKEQQKKEVKLVEGHFQELKRSQFRLEHSQRKQTGSENEGLGSREGNHVMNTDSNYHQHDPDQIKESSRASDLTFKENSQKVRSLDRTSSLEEKLTYRENEIKRLELQLESIELDHMNHVNSLQYSIERHQKQLKDKEEDLCTILIKLKPLLLEKHKILNPPKGASGNDRNKTADNARNLSLLEIFLQKYKIEQF